jgi:hypothetical protein
VVLPFLGLWTETLTVKIDHIWKVNCQKKDILGRLAPQFWAYPNGVNGQIWLWNHGGCWFWVLRFVLCLIMKIPMKQPVQGISERFLPLFG